LSLALDASLELLADLGCRTFRDSAPCQDSAQAYSAKNEGDFHRRSIENRSLMAILIPPELLLSAYRQGAFPMAVAPGDIQWFSPQRRGIIPLDDGFHVPHGTSRALRDPAWEVRVDTAFDAVMAACAQRRETWIDDVILESYGKLHALGHAHSVEAWRDGELAGGLYGVVVGGAFFGESMFHRVTNASKVALVSLVRILRAGGFTLLDTQWNTPHLEQFGAMEIPRSRYLRLLEVAVGQKADFLWPRLPLEG
jgi:leucyl/phenylalanyl-tRNA--protein transferase